MSTCTHTHNVHKYAHAQTHTHTFGTHQDVCVKHMYVNVQTVGPWSFKAEGDTNDNKVDVVVVFVK